MMVFSCFDAGTGLYDYYQSEKTTFPINADLPMPSLPAHTNDIGVPAIEASRPLPSDAKKIGSGWHARGIVSSCKRGSLSGLGSLGIFDGQPTWYLWATAGAVGLGAYGVYVLLRRR